MNPEQITANQRSKAAYVYIRQSSEGQVLHNKESQLRQRALVKRALELGWPSESVVEVDQDLGQSASRSNRRSGFHKMVADTATGQVGIILALEVSRLSRNNQDWYHLLDICAISGTLISDADGLYDPHTYNDRLLLGLKATMSEAELHVLKQRLTEAVRAKARRGEFQFRLPPGFVWDLAGRMVKTPDEQVQSTIGTIFERFEQLGSVHQVHSMLTDEGIEVPTLAGAKGALKWVIPTYSYVMRVLRNPLYAGAYAFGQRQVEEHLDADLRPIKRTCKQDRSDWHVLIQDHHEGYIAWEIYEKIQKRIEANRNGQPRRGAPREGRSLLQGLVLCGGCGRRMSLCYSGKYRSLRYTCSQHHLQHGAGVCQSFSGKRLERKIEQLVLEVLEPLGVEAMVEATRKQAEASESEKTYWRSRVERAQYEVDLARRQYDAVDPANRLVARELERRFEEALEALRRVEGEAEQRIETLERPLSEQDRGRLSEYAKDLTALWREEAVLPRDKKRIIRLLIENVTVTEHRAERKLQVEVHWIGEEVTRFELERPRRGDPTIVADSELIELITMLAGELSDAQIARVLSRKGIRTPRNLPFTAQRVAVTRNNHGIEKGPRVPRNGPDIHSAHEAGELLGVTACTVIRWAEEGLLRGSQLTKGAPWRIWVTEDDIRRLRARDAPEGWLTLKAAALALGISQQGVLQRLNSGKVNGVRVRVGRQTGWRIQVPTEVYDDQPGLY